mmetsp:Transcript_26873/g.59437  ORF Transcript_26873/g.59437 Transcript_26873/m.59437 type:complete len:422 (+) Transcript_26873:26-1291(+)|eukprot:CAMPEP_0204271694 /NCGR_PEP_ID=MMETSP0468-20130131/20783_1 /ASSEMBLY_ACC=CAM_ASM_000383 /TAXON_ID=2969 /ORGANISM="Oxyrrhis marina" /LENGTH=421 /DNA_ID=CAMNT_0051247429 /DNA_START=24 /DNA_END=1289 /DNA_ORIENTATION=+
MAARLDASQTDRLRFIFDPAAGAECGLDSQHVVSLGEQVAALLCRSGGASSSLAQPSAAPARLPHYFNPVSRGNRSHSASETRRAGEDRSLTQWQAQGYSRSALGADDPYDVDSHSHARSYEMRAVDPEDERPGQKKISPDEFDAIVKRLEVSGTTYAERRRAAQLERQAEIMKQCTGQPIINRRSRKMARHVEGIVARSQKVIHAHAQSVAKAKSEQEKKERSETRFAPEINAASRRIARSLSELHLWDKGREDRLRSMREVKDQQERDLCTFKPEVNGKSQKIFKQFRQTDEPAAERLLREAEEREAKKDLEREYLLSQTATETYVPSITSMAQRMNLQGRVFDRLYGDALARRQARDESICDSQRNAPIQFSEVELKHSAPRNRDQPTDTSRVFQEVTMDSSSSASLLRVLSKVGVCA